MVGRSAFELPPPWRRAGLDSRIADLAMTASADLATSGVTGRRSAVELRHQGPAALTPALCREPRNSGCLTRYGHSTGRPLLPVRAPALDGAGSGGC